MPEGGNMKRGFTEGAESALEARKKAAARKAAKPAKPAAKRSAKTKPRASKTVKVRADEFAAAAAAAS